MLPAEDIKLKPVIVTVDTEGHVGADPIRHLVYGETEDGRYGVEYIMDIFDEAHAKVLFFVDFAEAWDYGRDKIEGVVRTIIEKGHDVGVHIHPDHMADKQRAFLWQYSREEQYEIIRKCTELYTEIVGRRPLSFRAGKYGANRDTLDILCELGYKYDFSQFYHQKWCGINPPITVNAPCNYKNLIEFPVSMHKSIHMGRLVREDKLDIEQMTIGELRYGLKQISKAPFEMVATLFLHSFSMLSWYENPDTPHRDERKIKKVISAAKYVCEENGLQYLSESELSSVTVSAEQKAIDSQIVWPNALRGAFYTYSKAKRIAKRNKKARMLLFAVRTGMVLLLIFALLLLLK